MNCVIQHKHPVLSLPKFAIMTTGKRENVAAKYPQKNCPTKIIWWDSLVLRMPPDLVGDSRLSNIGVYIYTIFHRTIFVKSIFEF